MPLLILALACASTPSVDPAPEVGAPEAEAPEVEPPEVETPDPGTPATSFDGYNTAGEFTSCEAPPPMLMCTMDYTPEDAWAAECQAQGGTAFTCGCHSYLCSVELPFPPPNTP